MTENNYIDPIKTYDLIKALCPDTPHDMIVSICMDLHREQRKEKKKNES